MRKHPTTGAPGPKPRSPGRPPPPGRRAARGRAPLALLLAGVALGAAALFYAFLSTGASRDDRSAGDQAARHDAAPGRNAGAGSSAGSRAMAGRLAALADAADAIDARSTDAPVFGTNNPAMIPVLRSRLDALRAPAERVALRFQIANQLLLAGAAREALAELDAVGPMLAALDLPADRRREEEASLHGTIGIAALRLGEQENCVLNHGASSCLFPIERAGVHAQQAGARRAIEAFERQLALVPGDLGARWLLNLSYMTVGEYPAGVPARWLIPPDVFRSEHDVGRFRNVASSVGLDTVGLAGGSIVEDLDGDGFLDVMASSWGRRDQLRFFRNQGDGSFADRTREAGLAGQWGGINLVHADYDNDGHPDVLVLRGGWLRDDGRLPNSLLRNHGDGTFDDVTEAAGLLSFHPTHTAAWGDYDNDGYLDLFVGNEDAGSGLHPVQLYHNNGDGTFTDRAAQLGFGVLGMVKGTVWGDFDNDRRLDLYVSRFGDRNLLFRNDGADEAGRWRFTNVAAEAGVEEPIHSFPTWFWDYDNDGWLDLFVAAWDGATAADVAARYLGTARPGGTPRLYRNARNGTFVDVTAAAKLDRAMLVMGANFGDLDNDGFPDLYLGTGAPDLNSLLPNRMFRNDGGRVFQDVTTAGGFGHIQKGHGISFGDLDNDGDQDIHAVMGGWFSGDGYQNALFENPGHGRRWIGIALHGTRSNRQGVGARLRVRVNTAQGPRDIHKLATAGGSFGSSTLRQEIGLGEATSIELIEVIWPVSGSEVHRGVGLDRFVSIREGGGVTVLERKPIALDGGAAPGHAAGDHQPATGK